MKAVYYIILILGLISCNDNKTITSGIIIKGQQDKDIKSLFAAQKIIQSNPTNINFRVIKKEDTTDANYDLLSLKDTNNNIVNITFIHKSDSVNTSIQLSGSIKYLEDKIFAEKYENLGIIMWISQPFQRIGFGDINKNFRYELHLKVVDLISRKDVFENELFHTKCCIDRFSMKFNPFNNSILYSYNDYGRTSSKYLMYGYVKLGKTNSIISKQEPQEIISEDNSEKRHPMFIINDKSLFLYHTSGDRWGSFEHSGKQKIGISKISKNNQPIEYKIISDSFPIDENLILIGDTIFYRLENTSFYDQMIIKKISINDLK